MSLFAVLMQPSPDALEQRGHGVIFLNPHANHSGYDDYYIYGNRKSESVIKLGDPAVDSHALNCCGILRSSYCVLAA